MPPRVAAEGSAVIDYRGQRSWIRADHSANEHWRRPRAAGYIFLVALRDRPALAGIVLVAALALAYVVYATLSESDEDRVGAIADAFRGRLDVEAIDAALMHVEPERVPLEVEALGQTRVYGNGALPDLRRDAVRALTPMMGESIRELRRRVSVEGGTARAELQLLTSRGMGNVLLELVKTNDSGTWLLRRVQIRR